MLLGEPSLHDRSDGMYHIVAWQIIGRSDLRFACGFLISLRFHYLTALIPQTHPRKCVYAVVDTAVTGLPAACHSRIGGVDDRTASERCNIAFPEVNTVLYSSLFRKFAYPCECRYCSGFQCIRAQRDHDHEFYIFARFSGRKRPCK